MKNVSQAVKVGVLVIVVAIGAYTTFKVVGSRMSGQGDLVLYADFQDAAGLPEGSQVLVAGLQVGSIAGRELHMDEDDGIMKARMKLAVEEMAIYENASAAKKSSSLLGDYYIEIEPGSPTSIRDGVQVTNRRLVSGDEIKNVIEAATIDQLVGRVQESMPKVDGVLDEVRGLAKDVRELVNGPVKSVADDLADLVGRESETVSRILDRLDKSLADVQLIAKDIRAVTRDADERVDKILDNVDGLTEDARGLVASTRKEIEETGALARQKLDLVDEVLERSSSVMTKIDENQGTLGRLVNDSTLADNLEDITDDARGFVKTLFGMQTFVGLRTEYNVFAAAANNYVSVELRTRPDKFYLIEFNRGPRGAYPDTELVVDPVRDPNEQTGFRQRVTIRDATRITFMFGKRIDWLSLRFGIKDSSGGIGADGQWFNDQLKISVDLFDTTFNSLPRLKVAAAVSFFKHVYLLAGIDDALNDPLTITPSNQLDDGVPVAFEKVRFGRDYFVGGYIQFNDLDLTALLTIGSGILLAAAE